MKSRFNISPPVIILFCFLFHMTGKSQDLSIHFYEDGCRIDSLEALLKTAGAKQRVQLQVKIGRIYYLDSNYTEAWRCVREAEKLANQLSYDTGLFFIHHLGAHIFSRQGNFDSMIHFRHKSLEFAVKAGSDTLTELAHWGISMEEWRINRDPSYALEYFEGIKSGKFHENDCFRRLNSTYNLIQLFGQAKLHDKEWEAINTGYSQLFSCYDPQYFSHGFLFSVLMGPGRYQKIHGRFSDAIRLFNKALTDLEELNPPPAVRSDIHSRISNSISRAYLDWGEYDSALAYQKKAIAFYHESPVPQTTHGIIDLSNYLEGMGYAFLRLEKFDSAFHYFSLSKDIRIRIDDQLGIAMSDDGLGETKMILGNYFSALEYLDSALNRKLRYEIYWTNLRKGRSLEQNRTRIISESLAFTRLLMGRLYRDWGKFSLALENFNGSLADATNAGNLWSQAQAITEQGITYAETGDMELSRRKLLQAMSLADSMDLPVEKGRILHQLARIAHENGSEDEFLDNIQQADQLFSLLGMQRERAEVMKDLGEYWLSKGDQGKSMELLDQAYRISENYGLKKIAIVCCEHLSGIYDQQNQPGLALFYIKRYAQLRSEVYDLEAFKRISEIDAVHQLRLKEEQLGLMAHEKKLQDMRMNQNRYLMISLGALLIVIALVFALMIRNSRMKEQQKTILLERRLLRSQMNPHFIFNALTNIQATIFKNDPKQASKYLTHFSQLIRNILESTREEYISLHTEIRLIEDYLELQKLRNNNKFDFEVLLDRSTDPFNIHIPPMLAQPFVENAVEHGIRHKSGPGRITVQFSQVNETLHVRIQDDGIGRAAAAALPKEEGKLHRSMASQITIERLQLLHQHKNSKDLLLITDLLDDRGHPAGTRVEFDIPFTSHKGHPPGVHLK